MMMIIHRPVGEGFREKFRPLQFLYFKLENVDIILSKALQWHKSQSYVASGIFGHQKCVQ